jgi:hypothetical protein
VSLTVTEIVFPQPKIASLGSDKTIGLGIGQGPRAQRLFLCAQAKRRDQFACGWFIAHDNRLIFH